MTITSLRQQLGVKLPQEAVQESLRPDLLDAVKDASASLLQSIRDGTVTEEQIDSFLQGPFNSIPDSKKQPTLDYLLCKKAWLAAEEGRLEEALRFYEEALEVAGESPSTWALKGAALLQLDRVEEAFRAFQRAYSLRDNFGPQKQGYLKDLFAGWSAAALLMGLFGILEQHIGEAQKGAEEYIDLLQKAKNENLDAFVVNLATERPVSDEVKDALEELELMVRLLSIKDPFERWKELGKELSKVWPEGLSAVDAIRQDRDREWNT